MFLPPSPYKSMATVNCTEQWAGGSCNNVREARKPCWVENRVIRDVVYPCRLIQTFWAGGLPLALLLLSKKMLQANPFPQCLPGAMPANGIV